MDDSLAPDLVQPRLATVWLGKRYDYLADTPSTNTHLDQLARAGAAQGTVVVADRQRAGRGRLGRRWISPAGINVYLSVLVRPACAATDCPPLSLVAGVALADALCPLLPTRPVLKWPNDLLVGGRKLAGILVEMNVQGGTVGHVVIGIGINVNQTTFDGELSDKATSLKAQSGRHYDRGEVLARVLLDLERWLERSVAAEQQQVIDRWNDYATWLGQDVCVSTPQGPRTGTALGIGPDGALRLRLADGQIVCVLVGDVRIGDPAQGPGPVRRAI